MNLNDREWGEFTIGDIFDVEIGKNIDGNKIDKLSGKTPYITRKENNNGNDGFVDFDKKEYLFSAAPVITIGNETAMPFVQTSPFFTGTKVNIMKPKHETSKYALFFIAQSLKQQKSKYSYSITINSTRLKRQKILLPIDANHQPDYNFMEQYTKSLIDRKIDTYKKYIKKVFESLEYKEIPKLDEKEWGEFFIDDIVNIKSGKRLTKANMTKGLKPFIGATDSNNGITEFVSNTNESEDCNILGVNYNGSVAESFYHPYNAIFTDDVKRLSFKNTQGNKYLYLFLKNSISMQKSKYQYAYKFNELRLKRQKILLPIDANHQPDYEYMEQYIKNLEYKKIKQYLEYLR